MLMNLSHLLMCFSQSCSGRRPIAPVRPGTVVVKTEFGVKDHKAATWVEEIVMAEGGLAKLLLVAVGLQTVELALVLSALTLVSFLTYNRKSKDDQRLPTYNSSP